MSAWLVNSVLLLKMAEEQDNNAIVRPGSMVWVPGKVVCENGSWKVDSDRAWIQ